MPEARQYVLDNRLAVAPMMDWTDRHERFLLRLCSRHALLYTEMVPAQALWHGRAAHFLDFHAAEHPIALQLGGADPKQLAYGAQAAETWGYDAVNLNIGCPSARVQSGRFGACLMAEPVLVAELVAAMRGACSLPVTVKTRTGIDGLDDYAALQRFVSAVAEAGCRTFIVHARMAWLNGLNPKQNREIPPLHYDRVHALKRDFPNLEIILNGGLRSLSAAEEQLAYVDGVMIGRAAYQNPFMLTQADARIFGGPGDVRSRQEVVDAYLPYVERQCAAGVRLSRMTRHMVGLFQGLPGARRWRRHLSQRGSDPTAGPEVIREAKAMVASSTAAA